MTTITTGNPARDQRLIDAIASASALGDVPTLESVAAFLPDDFDLGADEFTLFVPQPIDAEFSVVETPDRDVTPPSGEGNGPTAQPGVTVPPPLGRNVGRRRQRLTRQATLSCA